MNKIIYLYVLETMAEWEVSNLLQAISMAGMLKPEGVEFEVKTVGTSLQPIRTLGGLTLTPDCTLEDIDEDRAVALLLPGAEEWSKEENQLVLQKALSYLKNGKLVAAICGATLALAELDVLNDFRHTSNSLEYLKLYSTKYTGEKLYTDCPACIDRNLVTASAAGGLLWAKYILEYLNVYPDETLELWYDYFSTGDPVYLTEIFSKIDQ